MADQKLADIAAATALDGTEKVYGTQSSADAAITTAQIRTLAQVAVAYTVATLPAGTAGQVAYVTDGDPSLAWGATAANSGAGATKYLVWFNGSAWKVVGK